MQNPQQEETLLSAFRKNPQESKDMIVRLTIASAELFHGELTEALASINQQEQPN